MVLTNGLWFQSGATERARELGIDVDTGADGSPVLHVISSDPYTVEEASAVSLSAALSACSTPVIFTGDTGLLAAAFWSRR